MGPGKLLVHQLLGLDSPGGQALELHHQDLAILLKELSGQRTKISLRSKGSVDVNRLARRFGGGLTPAHAAVDASREVVRRFLADNGYPK